MKKKVIISVTNDLVSDNRVHKVATSLVGFGFDITLVGRKLKFSPQINRNYKTKRFKLFFNKSALFYAEYNFRLFVFLIFHKSDILLSNDLDTLPANFIASKFTNRKLVYDSHELFTEVPELVNRPKVQKIWLKIENFILPKIKHSYTVCSSIALYYKKKYKIDMKVVKNVPFTTDFKRIKKNNDKKIILYQGAINIGRGLEELIESMQFINNAVLWIVGNGDILEKLKLKTNNLNLNNKVKFWGRIEINKLPEITIQADLGVSLEKNLGLNYYYALPNKIFDYIHSNVPVLCSNLPEMKKIINKYNIGWILNSHEPAKIAKQINQIFENSKTDDILPQNFLKAQNDLNWQNEEHILKEIFTL